MIRRRAIAVVLVLSMTLLSSGCSLTQMKRVPKDYKSKQVLLCSGRGWPVTDTVFAVVLGGLATMLTVAFSQTDFCARTTGGSSGDDCGQPVLYLGVLPVWVLFGLATTSSVYGYCWAAECELAKEDFETWRAPDESDTPTSEEKREGDN